MYKIVNLADLNISNVFIESDKVIELSADKTKMQIANNDWAHKNQSYLANCIDIADRSMTSYLKAINEIKTTYFTTDISNVYLKNGSAITKKSFNTIITSDAFLTKEQCQQFESSCKSYVDELKNKAVSLIMASLNASFINQNSVNRLTYGQMAKVPSGSSSKPSKVISWEDGITQENEKVYNFETGEFSLFNLLFDATVSESTDPSGSHFSILDGDAWNDAFFADKFLTKNQTYDSFEEILEIVDPSATIYAFNSDEETNNYKVNVPKNSFDYDRNKTIPIAKLVEHYLKRQIKKCISTVCDRYISKMSSVPTITKVTSS